MPTELTFTIEAPDGEPDEVTLPAGLVDLFNEADDPPARVVGDLVQVAFTQRAHALVHHAEDEVDDEVAALEEQALELFEQRFGRSFEEVTGHQH
ncbi:MAG: hypothetical protein ABEJ57_04510 [Halobacteriaceae archaeon]